MAALGKIARVRLGAMKKNPERTRKALLWRMGTIVVGDATFPFIK